jgi:organic hydroperoxide reductase OsmC/OhrA
MGLAAARMQTGLPADTAIGAEVDVCDVDGAYFLRARLNVSVPGLDHDLAQAIVGAAHQTCPYSTATRVNIGVIINVV